MRAFRINLVNNPDGSVTAQEFNLQRDANGRWDESGEPPRERPANEEERRLRKEWDREAETIAAQRELQRSESGRLLLAATRTPLREGNIITSTERAEIIRRIREREES